MENIILETLTQEGQQCEDVEGGQHAVAREALRLAQVEHVE